VILMQLRAPQSQQGGDYRPQYYCGKPDNRAVAAQPVR
jgi:hypothetical protein